MKTIVVVPTYNEAANVPDLMRQLFAQNLPGLELLVVDDNSPDGTAQVAEAAGAQFPGKVHVLRRARKEGLGPAYLAGYGEALHLGADIVIQMDADLSHPPRDIIPLLEGLKSYDVAVGSRYVAGGGVSGRWGLARRLLSRGGDLYVRWAMGLRLHDTKSGFKAFRREVLERLPLESVRSRGYIFQAEVVYLCQKMGMAICEVPYVFLERRAGRSKMSLAIIVEALWRPFQVRWAHRKVEPGRKPKG